VVDELRSIPAVEVVRTPVSVPHDVILQVEAGVVVEAAVADSTVQSNSDNDVCDADCLWLSDSVCSADELIAEQHSDASLADCWQQAKASKGDFVIGRDVVYHKDKVERQPIYQHCVPEGKSVQILKLAHDSVFGCHLGERKTRERVRLSFYWLRMRQDIQGYVQSCTQCQFRSRPMRTDHVLITPITRAELPFQVMNMDCIGPLDPPSAQGYKYCLCIVDSCTRWPTR